jgi:hypothetical protein
VSAKDSSEEDELARRVALQEILERLEREPKKNRLVIDVLHDLLGSEDPKGDKPATPRNRRAHSHPRS